MRPSCGTARRAPTASRRVPPRGRSTSCRALWCSPREAQALLTLEHLVESLEPALLGPHVKPLKARLAALLSAGDWSAEEVRKRIRVTPFGARRHEPQNGLLA